MDQDSICPLYKKRDKTYPANYRPISLTCRLCKVMEHVIASNISRPITQHNILYELQHGFREKCSCETQLIELVEDLARRLTLGKQTDLILLDFSKAFDKVNHLKLLYKLSTFGITGNTLKWIEAFLFGRSQTVVLEGGLPKRSRSPPGYPRGLYWARSSFFCTLTTSRKISNHKLDSLLMIPQFT